MDRVLLQRIRTLRSLRAAVSGAVASYTVEGDSFRADKPRLWSEKRFESRPLQRSFDLHPDGDRVALAAAAEGQVEAKQDKVVFIFNFFDELRRLAPVKR